MSFTHPLDFHFSSVQVTHSNGAPTSEGIERCCDVCGHTAAVMVPVINASGIIEVKSYCLHHALEAGIITPQELTRAGLGALLDEPRLGQRDPHLPEALQKRLGF